VRACVRLAGLVFACVSLEVASHGIFTACPVSTAVLEIVAETAAVDPVGLVEGPGAADVAAPVRGEAGRLWHHAAAGGLAHAADALVGELRAGGGRQQREGEQRGALHDQSEEVVVAVVWEEGQAEGN